MEKSPLNEFSIIIMKIPMRFLKIYICLFFGCIRSQLWHAGSFAAVCGLFVAVRGLLSSCDTKAH